MKTPFNRRTGKPGRRPVAVFDSGLRLRAGVALPDCLDNLRRLIPDRQPGVPKLLPARAYWRGAGRAPDATVTFVDDEGRFVVATLWAEDGRTEIGLFPLTSGPDRLAIPLIGHYAATFGSLSSLGTFQAGVVELAPPQITEDLLYSIVDEAGVPATPGNMGAVAGHVRDMVLEQGHQFIFGQDPAGAQSFVEGHRGASADAIVHELACWDPGVIPYIQDLPYRIQAILLERSPEGDLLAEIWNAAS
ncbi:hypothetical protein ACFQH9_06585 [Pseudonocardia lutea]|uniref:Uncharacterized protein n=1 Tax=Pseudonocardia lutea TaxID=2172015 RepID=A0ABW1I2L3_9PSEU